VTTDYVQAFPGGAGNAKSAGNYAPALLAEAQARDRGFSGALWLDGRERRFVEEAVSAEIALLIERLAAENSGWGYKRIQGELLKLGYRISASTIRRVLKALKIPPAPKRHTDTTWRKFPHAQDATMLATDFFHVDRAVTF
jgi:hypothetical protein